MVAAISAGAPATSYTFAARCLHWLTALLVLFLIPAGFYMANGPEGRLQDIVYDLHRSVGAVLIPVILVRLIYRLNHAPPPLPAGIALPQRLVAHAVHWALYGLLVIQPVVGWIATSAYRAPITVFWLFVLPPVWPENRGFSEQVFAVHRAIGIAMAVLLCAHIGGALFHHFIRRDTVLLRMVRGSADAS